MRTAFFSNRSTGRPDPDRPVLEQQQALLIEVLQRARGAPVSYAELNNAGVEFPASVVSELELAGVKIERCFARETGSRRLLGVRLAPAEDPHHPEPASAAAASRPISEADPRRDWEPVHVYRTGRTRTLVEATLAGVLALGAGGRKWARRVAAGWPATGSRMFALLALLAAAGVVAAVLVSAQSGSRRPRARAARARYHPPLTAHRQVIARRRGTVTATKAGGASRPSTPAGSTRTTSTATAASPPTPATPTTSTRPTPTPATQAPPGAVSSALATGLEARGHDLMVAGQYNQAVPVLQRALTATGERPGACSEPTTQKCLTYAFALYDLGRSLRLGGQPAAAVPILKHRLQIDNQRRVVAAELVRARRQARRRNG